MNISFTGTRDGMSPRQKDYFRIIMAGVFWGEFHHGDCIGADTEAHKILVDTIGPKGLLSHNNYSFINLHPASDTKSRAFNKEGTVHPPKPALERNKDIVCACINSNLCTIKGMLIVAPRSNIEELRSGTWTTVRYARKNNVPVLILPR